METPIRHAVKHEPWEYPLMDLEKELKRLTEENKKMAKELAALKMLYNDLSEKVKSKKHLNKRNKKQEG